MSEPRRYIRYSVSGYSSDTAVVYKYTWYSRIGLSRADTADHSRYSSDTAAIQQRYSSDTAEIQQIQQRSQQRCSRDTAEIQQRYRRYSTDTVTPQPPDAPPYHKLFVHCTGTARYSTDTAQIQRDTADTMYRRGSGRCKSRCVGEVKPLETIDFLGLAATSMHHFLSTTSIFYLGAPNVS
jgi:hypothetical protein